MNDEQKPTEKPSMTEGCREVLASLPDGRGVTVYECTICSGLWRLKDQAARCCGKTSRCQDCGKLAEYPYVTRCNSCNTVRKMAAWQALPTAPPTDLLFWNLDDSGDWDELLEAIVEAAVDDADVEESILLERHLLEAMERMMPVNSKLQFVTADRLYEYLSQDLLPEDSDDDELPDPLHTVVTSAVNAINAVAPLCPVSYVPGKTRPVGLEAELRRIAADYYREAPQ